MIHLRADYDRFQDPLGKIGEDEPVFILRAQDITAAVAVRAWAAEQPYGDLQDAAYLWADRMEAWAEEHADRSKMPDVPDGALRYP